jgi:peptide/nickel transport system permease protein
MIMGATLLFAVLTMLGNLLADILYSVFDPRIRYG